MVVRITNAGPDVADVHVLPTAWFRNTWAWEMGSERPRMRLPARWRRRHRPSLPR